MPQTRVQYDKLADLFEGAAELEERTRNDRWAANFDPKDGRVLWVIDTEKLTLTIYWRTA